MKKTIFFLFIFIFTIGIINCNSPKEMSTLITPGSAFGIDYESNNIYLADGSNGMIIIDITDPDNPLPRGTLKLGSRKEVDPGQEIYREDMPDFEVRCDYYDIIVSGNYAYIADYENGVLIADISDSMAPSETFFFRKENFHPTSLALHDNFLYVCSGKMGVVILDVSNPFSPVEITQNEFDEDLNMQVSSVHTGNKINGAAVKGNYAYFSDEILGLLVYDISNPQSPTKEYQLATGGKAWGLTIQDDYLYVSSIDKGLVIINISDPAKPAIEGELEIEQGAFESCVSGKYVYIATYDNGLIIADMQDRKNPVIVGQFETENVVKDIALAGKHPVLAHFSTNRETNGVIILDVSFLENLE